MSCWRVEISILGSGTRISSNSWVTASVLLLCDYGSQIFTCKHQNPVWVDLRKVKKRTIDSLMSSGGLENWAWRLSRWNITYPLSPDNSTQPGAVKTPTPLRTRCHHVLPSPQAQNPGLSWQPLLLYELHLAFTKVIKKLFCDCTVSGSQFKVQGIFNLQCHVEKQRKYPVSASIVKGMLLIPNKLKMGNSQM